MPGPAARVGDTMAHGGSIMGPGQATVLIGGMPAARISDTTVCPMQTPAGPAPIPHVGGPISPPGVVTVLIGGMPAATMGDIAICVGPPDTIAMGCTTVMIGTSGAGGGGGAGGGAAQAAQAAAAAAVQGTAGSAVEGPHWIEYRFVDTAGNPISGLPYHFSTVDNEERDSVLMADGVVRAGSLSQEGQCTVNLFDLHSAQWSTQEAEVGSSIDLSAESDGFESGTPATIEIWSRDIRGNDALIRCIETEVNNDSVEAQWQWELPEREQSDIERLSYYSAAQFYFIVRVGPCRTRSDFLRFQDRIELELLDENGEAASGQNYRLFLSTGEIREGTLDGNGCATEENVPPGRWAVEFPGCHTDEDYEND